MPSITFLIKAFGWRRINKLLVRHLQRIIFRMHGRSPPLLRCYTHLVYTQHSDKSQYPHDYWNIAFVYDCLIWRLRQWGILVFLALLECSWVG